LNINIDQYDPSVYQWYLENNNYDTIRSSNNQYIAVDNTNEKPKLAIMDINEIPELNMNILLLSWQITVSKSVDLIKSEGNFVRFEESVKYEKLSMELMK